MRQPLSRVATLLQLQTCARTCSECDMLRKLHVQTHLGRLVMLISSM